MPDFTPNINLEKPRRNEGYDVEVQNRNMIKIDDELHAQKETFTTQLAHNFYYKNTTEQCLSIRDNNSNFRIATFNVGSMKAMNNLLIQLSKQTINKSGANICCMQEAVNGVIFDFASKYQSSLFPESFFSSNVNNYRTALNYGLAIISEYGMLEKTATKYNMNGTTYEQRGYQRFVVQVNNQDVAIYNTHLSYESEALQQSQLTQLFNAVAADVVTHKIILGDFNTENLAMFSSFTNNGYILNNTGEFKTYKASETAIDNIITSHNVSVLDIGMVVSGDDSDHNLLYIDFNLQ